MRRILYRAALGNRIANHIYGDCGKDWQPKKQ